MCYQFIKVNDGVISKEKKNQQNITSIYMKNKIMF